MLRIIASLVPCPACRRAPAGPVGLCGACLRGLGEPVRHPGIVALGYYEDALKRAVLAVKFAAATRLAAALGGALGREVREGGGRPSAVCFVPLHGSKLRARGYDQAELLAAGAASALGVPLLPLLSRRTANTQQARLGLMARHANTAGLFTLAGSAPRVLPRRLLLVDDVMTSGATLEACRTALLAAGCGHVLFGVVALARPRVRSKSEGESGTKPDDAPHEHLGIGVTQ